METKSRRVAIGIDLGTTYSCVGVMRNGKVEIITNHLGNRTTPSCVAFTDSECLVGEFAKNQVAANSRNTILDSKKLMGRMFKDPTIQSDIKSGLSLPFKVVDKRGRAAIQVTCGGEEKSFMPEEVSALILCTMKKLAEDFLGHAVHDAVVAVPAYFENAQRVALKDACCMCGLNLLRLITEPVAAALSYGLNQRPHYPNADGTNILVFDLGGATFSVSLLTVDEGVFDVKAMLNDSRMGGNHFDHCMVQHFVREFKAKHGKDISKNDRALWRLRIACERAKHVLSVSLRATIEIEALYDGIDFCSTITRARFEDLCADFFHNCLGPIEQVLSEAKMAKSDVHEVVLIGGGTRIPKVQALVRGFFNGKELCTFIPPDEAIAYGAAMQAAILVSVPQFDKFV